MKKYLKFSFLFILSFLFINNIYAKDVNSNLSKSDIAAWGKKMSDTNKYAAFCVYSYEANCSSWTSDSCQRYVYAFGVPLDENASLEYYPIARKGNFSYSFYHDDSMKNFNVNSTSNSAVTSGSTFKKCTNNLTRKDFLTTEGYKCVNIDWDNPQPTDSTGKHVIDSNNAKTCGGWNYENVLYLNNAKYPLLTNANKSANVYSYSNKSASEKDKIDPSKQYVCTYNAITFTYDLENNKIVYRLNDSGLTMVNLKNMEASDFKDKDGKLSCPLLNCSRGSSGGDLTVTSELNVSVVSKDKYDNSESNHDCLIQSVGSTTGEQQKVDSSYTGSAVGAPDINISTEQMNCSELLGENLTKLVKFAIDTVKIIGAIIAIVNGMISLVPAVISKDQDALKKAAKKCTYMAIILALIFLLPLLARVIGNMFEFDISCFV